MILYRQQCRVRESRDVGRGGRGWAGESELPWVTGGTPANMQPSITNMAHPRLNSFDVTNDHCLHHNAKLSYNYR